MNCRAPKLAALLESAAFTMKVYMPEVDGVPLKSPPDVRVTPAGSDPPICDHVIDPAQQALSVLESGDPIVVEPRSPLLLMLIPPAPAIDRNSVTRSV